MSHHQHRIQSNDLDEAGDAHSLNTECIKGKCFNDFQACVICPPCDFREVYDSVPSDCSCPDFGNLCEDLPRVCCQLKNLCNTPAGDNIAAPVAEAQVPVTDYGKKVKGCQGCGQNCNGCSRCRACGCRQCCDYSRGAVVRALGGVSLCGECPNFIGIACDQQKKCCELVDLCKKLEPAGLNENAGIAGVPAAEVSSVHESSPIPSAIPVISAMTSDETVVPVIPAAVPIALPVEDKKGSTSGMSSGKGKKFMVSFGAKENHPWAEYNPDEVSIHINGKNGPVLHLYRGSTYFFCVEQEVTEGADPKFSFVLTNSPMGGLNSRIIPGGFAPVSKGCVSFKVDATTPRYFFYQNSKAVFGGGLVIVHDK